MELWNILSRLFRIITLFKYPWTPDIYRKHHLLTLHPLRGKWASISASLVKTFHSAYLLWTMACSTCVVLSDWGAATEFWLITDRNCSSSLVLSVFPAPDSPLENTHKQVHNPNPIIRPVTFSDIPVSQTVCFFHLIDSEAWLLQRFFFFF